MKVEKLHAEAYYPLSGLTYVDVHGLHDLYDAIAFKSNLILVGPKGIGKTLSIAAWAAKNHSKSSPCPIITFDCSEDIRRIHLIGTWYLYGSDSPFVLGPLPSAIDIANEVGACILQFEEINALMPQMQKLLNSITDWRRKIELPEVKEVFRLKSNVKLWVTGTMNNNVYGGTYALNEDLKSRMRMVTLNYPNEAEESKIIRAIVSDKIPKDLLKKILTLAKETRQKALEYSLSTRDLVQLLEDVELVGLQKALWILMGKFEGEDQNFIKTRCGSLFGGVK